MKYSDLGTTLKHDNYNSSHVLDGSITFSSFLPLLSLTDQLCCVNPTGLLPVGDQSYRCRCWDLQTWPPSSHANEMKDTEDRWDHNSSKSREQARFHCRNCGVILQGACLHHRSLPRRAIYRNFNRVPAPGSVLRSAWRNSWVGLEVVKSF